MDECNGMVLWDTNYFKTYLYFVIRGACWFIWAWTCEDRKEKLTSGLIDINFGKNSSDLLPASEIKVSVGNNTRMLLPNFMFILKCKIRLSRYNAHAYKWWINCYMCWSKYRLSSKLEYSVESTINNCTVTLHLFLTSSLYNLVGE